HGATEPNKPGADLADGATVVLPEIRNRLVIRDQPAREPHHLDVAPGLTLQPAARLNPVEIAVDVELQKDRRMIRRPAGSLWMGPAEPNRGQIQFIDKDVDYANRIVVIDPVLKACESHQREPARTASIDPPAIAGPAQSIPVVDGIAPELARRTLFSSALLRSSHIPYSRQNRLSEEKHTPPKMVV